MKTKVVIAVLILAVAVFSVYANFHPNELKDVSETTQTDLRTDKVNSENTTQLEKLKTSVTDKPVEAARVQPPQPTGPVTGCKIQGCNDELCVPNNTPDQVSSCSYAEVNRCSAGHECKIQNNGKCGWTPLTTAEQNACLTDTTFQTQKLRVLEVRYFPNGPSDPGVIYQPDQLSSELRQMLTDSSSQYKYNNYYSKPIVNVEVEQVININTARPNPDGFWYDTYAQMIADNDLCTKINNLNIDQIWLWVDPVHDTGPGLEFSVSSNYLQVDTNDSSYAKPSFCKGQKSFVIMGFDYTRPSDYALHSFGHLMESLLANLQGSDLFWTKFTGDYNPSIPGRSACGNVHFPPNGTVDYDYSNHAATPNRCEDWNPDGTGNQTLMSCTTWGCTQGGYLQWWFQNFPGYYKTLMYSGQQIPPWWDFIVDFDSKVQKYLADTTYTYQRTLVNDNISNNTGCSCSGVDFNGSPLNMSQCWETQLGTDAYCYQCQKTGLSYVNQHLCD